jgi:hypothetical protein
LRTPVRRLISMKSRKVSLGSSASALKKFGISSG